MVRISDIVESAIWITGDEHPGIRKRYESDVIEAIDYLCASEGFTHGPVRFIEKHPMDAGVAEVPDHIQGSRVRLLVAEADVTGVIEKGSIVNNLEEKDLLALRSATRRGAKRFLTDFECDQIIEAIGPDAVLDAMRKH